VRSRPKRRGAGRRTAPALAHEPVHVRHEVGTDRDVESGEDERHGLRPGEQEQRAEQQLDADDRADQHAHEQRPALEHPRQADPRDQEAGAEREPEQGADPVEPGALLRLERGDGPAEAQDPGQDEVGAERSRRLAHGHRLPLWRGLIVLSKSRP
jgi:hypothetical protein